jgi:hypothetical protein
MMRRVNNDAKMGCMTDSIADFLDDLKADTQLDPGIDVWGKNPPNSVFERGFNLEGAKKRLARGYIIKDKKTSVPLPFGALLVRRKVQRDLANFLISLLRKGGPVRVIVLKSRKLGVSTIADWLLAELSIQIPGWYSAIIAHSEDSSKELFDVARRSIERMESLGLVPELRVNNDKEMEFGARAREARKQQALAGEMEHGGKMKSGSAGDAYALSGHSPNGLHLSECAKYDIVGDIDRQERVILSVLGSMSKSGPSIVIAESTANGQQGWFYKTFVAAMKAQADGDGVNWVPVFIPWFKDPDCWAEVPSGYVWEKWDADDRAREKRLVEQYKLKPQQLYFRRRTLAQDLGMNPDYWDQEYPDSWETAFISSGAGLLGRAHRERMRTQIQEPIAHGDAFDTPEGLVIKENHNGSVRIFERPIPGAHYVLGADVADGVTFAVDPAGRPRTDSSTFSIMRRTATELIQVAECVSYADNMEFGRSIAAWGKHYNDAVINVERNRAHGVIAGLTVAEYPTDRFFRPPVTASVSGSMAGSYFFVKTHASGKLMIDSLVSWANERLVIRSARLLEELGTLRRDSTGRVETNGKDLTIALCMGIVVDQFETIPLEAVPGALAKVEFSPNEDPRWAWEAKQKELKEKAPDGYDNGIDGWGGGWDSGLGGGGFDA